MDKRKLTPDRITIEVKDPDMPLVEKEVKEAYRQWGKDVLTEKGWDLMAWSKAAGISHNLLTRPLNDDKRDMSWTNVCRLAEAAGMPPPMPEFSQLAKAILKDGKSVKIVSTK